MPSKRKRRRFFGSSTPQSLQGIESLEDRRLLSVSPGHVEDGGYPLDNSDWSLSTTPARLGGFDQGEVFGLQSKPDSNFTIYLDFDGHTTTNTTWNDNYGIDTIVSPAFDLDGDPTSFGQSELERIFISWQRTAEDFAAFDINVTTRDPGLEALVNSGGGDSAWGVRAVATFDTFADCGCGGHAYLNSFSDDVDTPTFVYNLGQDSLGETFSHEVGHMLGLSHDGDSTQAYYPGHGPGETSWGTIMGAAFNPNVSQWSEGDYFDANNFQDDLSIITTQNGFGYRADDFGGGVSTAWPLNTTNGINVDVFGNIERNTDRDYFSFETGNGDISFQIDPLGSRPNLDVFAAIYDGAGNLIAFDNPTGEVAASLDATVTAGTYYLRVEGVGSDDVYNSVTDNVEAPAAEPWQTSSPSGYSDYGSLGQYTVDGTVVAVGANTLSIAATSGIVTEGESGQTDLIFTVTRSGDTTSGSSVSFAVVDTMPNEVGESSPSLADAADFVAGTQLSGNLDFSANQTTATITFSVAGDTDFEFDEFFDVVISNASSGWSIADSRATAEIQSDENRVLFSTLGGKDFVNEGPFNGALVRWRQVGAAGAGYDEWAIDNIALSNSTLSDTFDPDINDANWSVVSNGFVSTQFGGTNALTFNGGSDRRLVTQFLDASPGDTLSFDIIFGDGSNGGENVDEGEDVLLEFSLDGGSNWSRFSTFDSEDHTSWSSVSAQLPTGIDTNPTSELTFTVTREGGISGPATVDWAIDDVGVTDPASPDDFIGGAGFPSGQLNFAGGQSTATIAIPILADLDFEANENFRLELLSATGTGTVSLTAGATTAIGTIENDDAGFNVNPGAQFRLRQLDSSGDDFDNWAIDNVDFFGMTEDDFDPDVDLTQWSQLQQYEVNTNFGGNGQSLYMTGNGERLVTTYAVNPQLGDVLSFDFIYGDDDNGGENPEEGEEVVLEYSTDGGGSWVNIDTYDLGITAWTPISQEVPAATVAQPDVQEEGVNFDFNVARFGIDTDGLGSTIGWEIVGSGTNPVTAADFPGGVFPTGTLSFAPGEISQTVTISVLDDSLPESDETFEFVLSTSSGNPIGSGTITDNDEATGGDFNSDGILDCDDIDALVANIVAQTNVPTYDMNGDGLLDNVDLDDWLSVAGATNLGGSVAYEYGDANLDGNVDGADFAAWSANKFTSGAGWCGADFNASGSTDAYDFLIWNANKTVGSTSNSPQTPKTNVDRVVPELAPVGPSLVVSQPVIAGANSASLAAAKAASFSSFSTDADRETTVRRADAAIAAWNTPNPFEKPERG